MVKYCSKVFFLFFFFSSVRTSYENALFSEIAILSLKWSQIEEQKKVDLCVVANHPALYSGELGLGYMAVAVRASGMVQVSYDTQRCKNVRTCKQCLCKRNPIFG